MLCWNHEKYIKQSLESIFAQTNKDFEILFLDNTSTDNSFETAKHILENSGFAYQIYRNKAPQPVPKNLNFLLDRSSGEYIFPFSADDWMATENIAEKVSLLKSKADIGLVFGGGWNYYEDTGNYSEINRNKFKRGNMVNNLLLDRESYFYVGPAYKRSAIMEVGKWDENLLMEDLDLNLRIAMKYQVDFVPQSLIYYRRHSASYTANYPLLERSFQQYYEKYKRYNDLPIRQWMSDTYRHLTFPALNNKDYGTTLKFLYKSFLLRPGIGSFITAGSLAKELLAKVKPIRSTWRFARKLFVKS